MKTTTLPCYEARKGHNTPTISTRAELEAYFYRLYEPTKAYRQPHNGRLHFGTSMPHYSQDQADIEGFLRLLWGVGPMAGNGSLSIAEFRYFIDCILHSTTVTDPAYWGEAQDLDQMIVEMASLAVTLIETRELFWQQLTLDEQDNVFAWLNRINQVAVHHNNWRFFRILVNVAFIKLNLPHDQELLENDLAVIDSFYVGQGWYVDGNPRQQDYYIPWAFHYYGLLYAYYMEESDPERSQRFSQRGKDFAKSFVSFFDQQGRGIPFGRSLSYRFAEGAFWAVAAFTGIEVLPMPQIKYLIMQHFSYWQQQAIQKTDGILSIGYAYENFFMSERYNGPGSPYWCFKAFIVLALPKEDPFWQLPASPPPFLEETFILEAKLLLANPTGRQAFLYPVNQWSALGHGAEKYSKLVYSSLFGFSVSRGNRGLLEGAFDNCLAVAENGSEHYFSKEETLAYEIDPSYTRQVWEAFPGTQITTTVVPLGNWHLRIHKIVTKRDLRVADGGFSNQTLNSHPGDYVIEKMISPHDSGRSFTSTIGTTAIVPLKGYQEVQGVFAEPNTNLLFQNSQYLVAKAFLKKGQHVLISLHYAGEVRPSALPDYQLNPERISVRKGEEWHDFRF